MIDLAVAYRIYPGISWSPAFFPENKFKLAEMCLHSFKRSLGRLRVKIWALLDGCPPNYEMLFRALFADDDLEVLNLNKEGNLATFSRQIDILSTQAEAPYVYFAEDDYFYLPNALEKMVDFMRGNPDADFVTAYDHPDCYRTPSRLERYFIRAYGDRHWRTASSTCLTFLTSRQNLLRTQAVFRTFCRGNMDCALWFALTQKLELANLRIHWHDVFRLKAWVKTLQWGMPALLFGRRNRLWSPLPSLGTHLESTCLAPLVDWRAHFVRSQSKGERA